MTFKWELDSGTWKWPKRCSFPSRKEAFAVLQRRKSDLTHKISFSESDRQYRIYVWCDNELEDAIADEMYYSGDLDDPPETINVHDEIDASEAFNQGDIDEWE